MHECPGCYALISTMRKMCLQCELEPRNAEEPKSDFGYYIPGSAMRFTVIQEAGTAIVRCKCDNIVYLGSVDPGREWTKCSKCSRSYSLNMDVVELEED